MIFAKSLPESNGFLKTFDLKSMVIRYLVRLITGFLMHRGRMSSQQAASAIATQSRHRGRVSRFLRKQGHQLRFIRHQLARQLLNEAQGKGPYILILDATDVTQQGTHTENTFSVGNRQRRPNNTKRYNKRSHRRFSSHRHVMGLLLTPSGERIPFYLPYYTKTYCQDHHLPYRTQADLGAELISSLPAPSGGKVVVLGDTAFESKQVRTACRQRGWTWIMPANPERVLAGEKPRPKVASLLEKFRFQQFVPIRLQPGKGPWAALRRTAPCRLGSKTKPRTYYVHQERRDVHSLGVVQIVFSTTYEPQRGKPLEREKFKILLCNDLQLSAESIVALYTLRWQIEMFFKELKSVLGMHHYRLRRFHCVEAWVEACLITYLYLEWIRSRRLRSKKLTKAEQKWWRWQRSHGIASAVRQRIEETEITRMYKSLHSDYGVRKLRRELKSALPTEYRHAA
jgi:DDE family transposase